MKKDKSTPEECLNKLLPVIDALDVLKGKWKIQIISVLLHYEKCSFKLLKESIPRITPRMLSKELKDLEMHLLVDRIVLETRPLKVSYEITDYGKSVAPVIKELYLWGQKHRDTIIANMRK